MLSTQQLSRHYGHLVAVDEVSFSAEKGEITGLLGHNGAGKTTVMKLLTGYLEPTHGEAYVNELNVQEHPQQARRLLGYLPEVQSFYPEQSVADYLWFAGSIREMPENDLIDRIKEVMRETELMDRAFDTIGTLSRGYQQRVGVAQAILHRPEALILDEPTNGLDPTQTAHMRRLIQQLATDATVILSTHIMQEVEAICDRVLILLNGKLVVDEKIDDLRKTSRILLRSPSEQNGIEQAVKSLATVTRTDQAYALAPMESENAKRDLNEFTARVANSLVNSGVVIHGLEAERRDLEQLFHDVSDESDAD